jgi:hypothetical protein
MLLAIVSYFNCDPTSSSIETHKVPLKSCAFCKGKRRKKLRASQGRGGGVGRALGVGVGRGVTIGVTVGVALGVGLTIGVGVGVGVGVPLGQ